MRRRSRKGNVGGRWLAIERGLWRKPSGALLRRLRFQPAMVAVMAPKVTTKLA
ncbi:MAG: hypothetical protein ACUVXB_17765 [Bryobacteraceae bacterium]